MRPRVTADRSCGTAQCSARLAAAEDLWTQIWLVGTAAFALLVFALVPFPRSARGCAHCRKAGAASANEERVHSEWSG